MKFIIDGATLSFRKDEDLDQTVCHFRLDAWSGYTSENSREGCEGENVILVLEPEGYDAHPSLAPKEKYENALKWLLANQSDARDAVLSGIMTHIEVMRTEYGIDDEELNIIAESSQLRSMVDLSFVRIFPHSRAGVPYLGFELECNWDPEHGCGVLINGSSVVDAGVSDSAQSIDAIEDHGGAV